MRRPLFISGIIVALTALAWGAAQQFPLRDSGTNSIGPAYPDGLYDVALRSPVDSICVIKRRREMLVFRNDSLLKVYRVALGDTPVGHKHFQGDERTPEGLYRIHDRNPASSCHKNLGISYPNARDRAYASSAGRPAGGDIKIHGLPNGQGAIGREHLLSDWTNGCVGVTNAEIDELFTHVLIGSPILILP